MKSPYAGLWFLLSLALVAVLVIAFSDDMVIGEWTVRKAPYSDYIFKEADMEPERRQAAQALADSLELARGLEAQVDSTPQNIFIFGDSMTQNLALRLGAYARANGHTMHAVNWDSSNTKIWADSDTLDYFIRRFEPTFVFITLGSNELYMKHPEQRLPYVKRILDKIGDIPYVWIGPPNWQEDYGINDMIQNAVRRGSFFRSAGMEFQRKKDHVHPTRASSALWMDSIMRWLPKSSHPFVAALPPDSLAKGGIDIIYLKALNK